MKIQNMKGLGSAIFLCLKGIPRNDYKTAFKNWIKRLKLCIAHGGEYFEGIQYRMSKTGHIMGSPVAGGRAASSSLSGAYLQNYTS